MRDPILGSVRVRHNTRRDARDAQAKPGRGWRRDVNVLSIRLESGEARRVGPRYVHLHAATENRSSPADAAGGIKIFGRVKLSNNK